MYKYRKGEGTLLLVAAKFTANHDGNDRAKRKGSLFVFMIATSIKRSSIFLSYRNIKFYEP